MFSELLASALSLSRCVFYCILHLQKFSDQFSPFSVKSAGLLRQSNTLASSEITFADGNLWKGIASIHVNLKPFLAKLNVL